MMRLPLTLIHSLKKFLPHRQVDITSLMKIFLDASFIFT